MLDLDARGQGLWRFPRPVKYTPRPQTYRRLTNDELVEALVADAQRAAVIRCECEFSDSGLRLDVCTCCLQGAVAS